MFSFVSIKLLGIFSSSIRVDRWTDCKYGYWEQRMLSGRDQISIEWTAIRAGRS